MCDLATVRHAFHISPSTFKAIVKGFKAEYDHGLSAPSASGLATMIPSYVTRLPSGTETGTYLALDLGGSTLRVCAVHLLGNGQVNVNEVRRPITDTLRHGTCDAFFDWIADTVAELISQLPGKGPFAMGVCWSFPLNQTSLTQGTILRMGKGFTLSGIDGQDLATLFAQAFERRDLHVVVTALINDTIGALVAHAYSNPKARVGFIYGTGVNAAYPEKVSRIVKLGDQAANWEANTEMLVNTEIDIFGNDTYLPRTRFDHALDANHAQPTFQPYEKMMSGAYLGELVRLIAIEQTSSGKLFAGQTLPAALAKPWAIRTAMLSEIEGNKQAPLETRLKQLQTLLSLEALPSESDLDMMTEICEIVSSRAAVLAAAALASAIEQQAEALGLYACSTQDIVIGVNGTTFEKYPGMPERITESLQSWFGISVGSRIKLEIARDGGSIGGALVAMLYQEQTREPSYSTKKSLDSSKPCETEKSLHVSTPKDSGCLFQWKKFWRNFCQD